MDYGTDDNLEYSMSNGVSVAEIDTLQWTIVSLNILEKMEVDMVTIIPIQPKSKKLKMDSYKVNQNDKEALAHLQIAYTLFRWRRI